MNWTAYRCFHAWGADNDGIGGTIEALAQLERAGVPSAEVRDPAAATCDPRVV